MTLDYLIFDLDDTLYPPTSGVWDAIGVRINQFLLDNLKLAPDNVNEIRQYLFNTYGTTLRGLQTEYGIDPYKYLNYVHNIQLETYLQPNPELKQILKRITSHKVIFTNSDQNHALRVLGHLALDGIFERIIDILDVAPYCKPQPEAFEKALNMLGNPDPEHCLVVDDSVRNIQTASEMGFKTILVGSHNGNAIAAHARLDTIMDLPRLTDVPFLQDIWRPA